MEKMVSKGLKQPFFSCCGCRNPTGKQGQNGLQKCLLVKARHQKSRAVPSNPRSAGIFPAKKLASKTAPCHQAGHQVWIQKRKRLRENRILQNIKTDIRRLLREYGGVLP